MRAARSSPGAALPVAGVAMVLTLVVGSVGLLARDLAGDEHDMLHGTPSQIAQWALDPRGGFVGHLPWSYWLRWAALSVLGEDGLLGWRLHALVGTGLTAGLVAWATVRHLGTAAGVVAGLLIAVDPILAFHAQDASNYAWTGTVGALLVVALLELQAGHKRGAAWLAVGLMLGAMNDFYAVLLGIPVVAWAVAATWRTEQRRAVLGAVAGVAAVVLPVVAVFGWRLLSSTEDGVVAVHADPLPPRPLPALLDAPWRVARRLLGAHLHGYAGGRDDAPWVGGPPVLAGLLLGLAALRSKARPAAALLLGSILLHGVLGVCLQLWAGRVLPYEPRSLIGVTPALAVALGALTQTRRGMALGAGWLLLAGLATLQARLSTADLRLRALADARALALPIVSEDPRVRARDPSVAACSDRLPVAWITLHDASVDHFPWCGEPQPDAQVRWATHHDAPVFEGSAASFLPRRVVAWVDVSGEPAQASGAPTVTRSLWDGLGQVAWEVHGAQGPLQRGSIDLGAVDADAQNTVRVVALPSEPSRYSHPLLSPWSNQLADWEVDLRQEQVTLSARPLAHPALSVLRRILPLLISALAATLLVRPR